MINTIIICILIFIIIGYYIINKQEYFDPSLVPVSSIVSLAKVVQKIVDNNGTLINPGNLNVTLNVITNILFQLNNRNAPTNNINISLQFDRDMNNNNILSIWFNNNSTGTPNNLSQFSFKYDGGLYLGNKTNTSGTGAFLSSYKDTNGLFKNGELSITNTANNNGTLKVKNLGLINTPCTIISNVLNTPSLNTNNILSNTSNLIQINKTNSNSPDTSVIKFDTSIGSINTTGNIRCNCIIPFPLSYTQGNDTFNTIPGAYLICANLYLINNIETGNVYTIPIFNSGQNLQGNLRFFGWVIVAPKYKLEIRCGTSSGAFRTITIDNPTNTMLHYNTLYSCFSIGVNLFYDGLLV